jgi:hypothetical protein
MDGKSAKKGPKTGKNRPKNVKKPLKKSKFALAHLTKGTPSAEKTPRTPAPGPVGSKKSPKNTPQNLLQKVIHNLCRAQVGRGRRRKKSLPTGQDGV